MGKKKWIFKMSDDIYEIGEDEIRVAGAERHRRNRKKRLIGRICLAFGVCALIVAIICFVVKHVNNGGVDSLSNQNTASLEGLHNSKVWFNNADVSHPSCIVVTDKLIDSVHMKILTPYNTMPELVLGTPDSNDTDILLATLAADVRRDNGKIVGAFVLAGEPLSWGLSKRGYCAISEDGIAVGVAENSPLFEQATEHGGSFFRQYPAVDKGKMVHNNPQNISFRRALCTFDDKVCIVVSTDRLLMNDFSTALVKLGVQNAIFLVGGTADGWYRTADGKASRLGYKKVEGNAFLNYLVFRAQ